MSNKTIFTEDGLVEGGLLTFDTNPMLQRDHDNIKVDLLWFHIKGVKISKTMCRGTFPVVFLWCSSGRQ